MAKVNKDALGERVYETIKKMMLDGVLVPEKKISKSYLAETMGVSQTPVGEALSRLLGEGLLELRQREGYFVKPFSFVDLRDIFAVRAGLEGIAIRICVEELNEELELLVRFFDGFQLPLNDQENKRYLREDQQFHKSIIDMSGNPMIMNFERVYNFMLKSYQKGLIRPPAETLHEHLGILDAIKRRDAKGAQELMIEHIMNSRRYINEEHLKYQSTPPEARP